MGMRASGHAIKFNALGFHQHGLTTAMFSVVLRYGTNTVLIFVATSGTEYSNEAPQEPRLDTSETSSHLTTFLQMNFEPSETTSKHYCSHATVNAHFGTMEK